MKQDLIFSEAEMNNNPLLRKMRERFTCSGNMTIGEIMLHRAEKDIHTDAPEASETTVAAHSAGAAVAKRVSSPFHASRRALVLSCLAIAVCAALLLAFIIPVFGNFTVDAQGVDPVVKELSEAVEPVEEVVEESPAPVKEKPASTYENAMDAFYNAFGY